MDAALIAEKLLQALSAPYRLQGETLTVGASIGVALYPQDGRTVDVLLKHSDAAMYQAKRAGRGMVRCFDETLNTVAGDQLLLVAEMHKAFAAGDFTLLYQPQRVFADGRPLGLEAQISWRHPRRGLIPAPDFLPMAEEAGLSASLAQWALREACRAHHSWRDQGLSVPKILINLTSHQLRDARLRQDLCAILVEADLDARSFGVQITEDDVMDDAEQAVAILTKWQSLGLEVSLSEFGAGYSSLAYLKRLPLDAVKLDVSFTEDSAEGTDGSATTGAVVAMLQELGLRVVAAGVDTELQHDHLRLLGCDAYQGGWAGGPQPAADCGLYLTKDEA